MKYFLLVFLVVAMIPRILQAQTEFQTEVIARHDSIQLLIDQLISKQRDEKKISPEHCDSINIHLVKIKSLQSKYVKVFPSGILDSLSNLYVKKTQTLLKSAGDKRDGRYSDNAILAYEFASNQLYIFKSRRVDQLTRDTISKNYKSLLQVENHLLPDLARKVKDVHSQVIDTETSINSEINIFESSVNDSFTNVNELLLNLQPKKNLSNYLIHTGIIFPDDKQGGLIGAYVRFDSSSNLYWGGHAVFATMEEGRSLTIFQAGLNVDVPECLFLNFNYGISLEDQSNMDWAFSVGGGLIFESKSYWNPRVGLLGHFEYWKIKGISLQFVLPVGVKYPDCKKCRNQSTQ